MFCTDAKMSCVYCSYCSDFIFPVKDYVRLGGAPLDVATGHVQLIKVLTVLQSMDLHFRCWFCCFARLDIKIPSLIKSMFPLHVLACSNCKSENGCTDNNPRAPLGLSRRSYSWSHVFPVYPWLLGITA